MEGLFTLLALCLAVQLELRLALQSYVGDNKWVNTPSTRTVTLVNRNIPCKVHMHNSFNPNPSNTIHTLLQ